MQVLSFYKIFGYPTGLGALIVRKDAAADLRKRYFGGGAVAASVADEDFYRWLSNLQTLILLFITYNFVRRCGVVNKCPWSPPVIGNGRELRGLRMARPRFWALLRCGMDLRHLSGWVVCTPLSSALLRSQGAAYK